MSIIDIQVEDHERFRGELASIAKDGRRKWIYSRKPSGKFTQYRTYLSWILLVFLFAAPHIKVNGLQFMLFNILERKFVIFGVPFWTQDFYLVLLLLLTLMTTIVLFTSAFGRLWCGWLCPQTIFLEMLYRKIEFWIEGSPQQQILLDKSAWTKNKILKKSTKHTIFYLIAFAVSNTFLSYIIGSDALLKIISDPPSEHVVGLISIIIFSFIFYSVFARFREQACIIVCPYGRYMSTLVDEDTVTITYDVHRGEPRKKFSKEDRAARTRGETLQNRGDCIDCHQCVTVCPTGIDIRNGIQLECVSCTACIDACDDVMDKIEKPRGLIRHTSFNAAKTGISWSISRRTIAYAVVWILVVSAFSYFFFTRPMLHVLVLRQSGTTFAKSGHDRITNFYSVQTLNKTSEDKSLSFIVKHPEGGTVQALGDLESSPSYIEKKSRMLIHLPVEKLSSTGRTNIVLETYSSNQLIKSTEIDFLSPMY